MRPPKCYLGLRRHLNAQRNTEMHMAMRRWGVRYFALPKVPCVLRNFFRKLGLAPEKD